MDRLRAYLLVSIALFVRERERVVTARLIEKRENPMARDLRSLSKAIGQFHSDLDVEAGKLFDKMDGLKVRAGDAVKKAHARLDAQGTAIGEIDHLVTDLERVNDPSSAGSQHDGEPQKSWASGSDDAK